jgi:hypothetical protein
MSSKPTIELNPHLTSDQLFDFYSRNEICEVGFGKDGASRILDYPQVMVAALLGAELVGLARATFDGLSAHIMEFSLDLRWQGENRHGNGSLVESDPHGLAASMGNQLLAELERLGCSFVSGYIVAGTENGFYEALGFRENEDHLAICIDKRPYVAG